MKTNKDWEIHYVAMRVLGATDHKLIDRYFIDDMYNPAMLRAWYEFIKHLIPDMSWHQWCDDQIERNDQDAIYKTEGVTFEKIRECVYSAKKKYKE